MLNTMDSENQPVCDPAQQQLVALVRSLCLPPDMAPAAPSDLLHLDLGQSVAYALAHGLGPLLRQGLLRSGAHLPGLAISMRSADEPNALRPEDLKALNLLKDSYLSTLRRNLQVQAFLKQLDQALTPTGIPCIVWKGAAYICNLYPNLGLRPMDDIDLMLLPADLEKFKGLLSGLGFTPRTAYPLTWQQRNLVVDVHVDAVHSDRIPSRLKALPLTADRVLQNARPLTGFRNLLAPSAADTLICLAVHALKHNFCRDIWLADTAYLLHQDSTIIATPRAWFQSARDLGAALPLFLLFARLERWPHNLDLAFASAWHPEPAGWLARRLIHALTTERPVPYAGEVFYLLQMNTVRDQAEFMLDTLFPSLQVMQQLFPGKSGMPYWAYCLRRIGKLALMGACLFKALLRSA